MPRTAKKRVPHKKRPTSGQHPYHIVLTLLPGVPRAHSRQMRELFIHWLAETASRYPISASFGVGMPDHLHLIVQTPKAAWALPRAMQFLKSKFALAVNRTFSRKGAVFKDRYFSRILKTPSELVQAFRYLAKNPIKAGLCRRASDWPASAVIAYLSGQVKESVWKCSGFFYRILGFYDDPREALLRILRGETRPVRPSTGRQLRLPFKRGLPGTKRE